MSNNNDFFKPTLLYKEFMILDLIEKNAHVSQREMAVSIGVAVSMINGYINIFEQSKLITRKKHSTKTVEYFITKKGSERRKLLNISYLKSSNNIYIQAKDNIISFLNQIIDKGFKKIILYGAGEVAEILLQTIVTDKIIPIKVLAVVDDNPNKQKHTIVNTKIISLSQVNQIDHDGMLISSHTNRVQMLKNLQQINYNQDKILNFFEI